MKEKKEIISSQRRTEGLSDMQCVLGPFARKMLGKKAFAEADVLCHWKEIVGDETAGFSRPLKIEFKKDERTGGVLWVEIAGGAFALEIQSKTPLFIDRVNTFFGYEAVKDIRIIQNPSVFNDLKQPTHNFEKTLVSPQEEIYINDLSSGVQNEELEQALQALGRAVIGHNKKK